MTAYIWLPMWICMMLALVIFLIRHVVRTRLRHSSCPARVMKHVKIPVEHAEWIGGPSVQ